MRIVAIIQARMGSTRLRGKVLKKIAGNSMLARVVARTSQASKVNQVVVATTGKLSDDAIVEECKRLGIAYFRGSENDVLDRYYKAAQAYEAQVIVRITADCPFIEPQIIDQVVSAFLVQKPDYASNVLERTFPQGLDTEVMGFQTLRQAWQAATEDYQRIHVTPYIYQHPELFRLLSITSASSHGDKRWTVDTVEDLKFAQAVYSNLNDPEIFGWKDVLALLSEKPELACINSRINQKELYEG